MFSRKRRVVFRSRQFDHETCGKAGELANLHAALLPIIAGLGGVAVPALLYAAFNIHGPGAGGWGIPMATDIAFALGVFALFGNRIPFGLKVFLTAVAIVDDLIAVLMIAFFYSSGISWVAPGIGCAILAVLLLGNVFGIRATLFYTGLGVVVWLAFLQSGIHATIAGVLVAFTVPARTRIEPAGFIEQACGLLHRFKQSSLEPNIMLTDQAQQSAVIELEEACEDVQAPLQKLDHCLRARVQLGIVPIFALANAGVALSPLPWREYLRRGPGYAGWGSFGQAHRNCCRLLGRGPSRRVCAPAGGTVAPDGGRGFPGRHRLHHVALRCIAWLWRPCLA